jgi:pimeloyl-ACP methyl ester carboxylesterase
METRWVPVAEGLGLATDTWAPAARTDPDTPATFVLVHGLASNARTWDGVAGHLVEAGHRVIAVDLRGHGRSSKPDGPYDVPTVARDLAALVDALELRRPIIAGQSWGGNVVLELAAAHAGLARGIVCVDGGWLDLASTFPDWEACAEALAPPHLAGLRRDAIEQHLRAAHPDWPESGIAGTLGNFETHADGTVAPWLTFDRHMTVLRGMWDHHPAERYPEVGAPVLLAPADTGDAARTAAKRASVDAALEALPRARVRWFTGDHDIHAQRPGELAGVMLETLDGGFFA